MTTQTVADLEALKELCDWCVRVEFQRPNSDGSTSCRWEIPQTILTLIQRCQDAEAGLNDAFERGRRYGMEEAGRDD